jgi:hypothetical protein
MAGRTSAGAVSPWAAGDPKRALRPADQERARKAILAKHDLPHGHWTERPTDFTQPNPPCVGKHYGLSAETLTGQTGTVYSGSDQRLVESDGLVFATAAQAKRAFSVLSSVGLARCNAQSVIDAIQGRYKQAIVMLLGAGPYRLGRLDLPARATIATVAIGVKSRRDAGLELVYSVAIRSGRTVAVLSLARDRPWPETGIRSLAPRIVQQLDQG